MNPLEEYRPRGLHWLSAGTRHASATFTNYFEAFKNMTVLRQSGIPMPFSPLDQSGRVAGATSPSFSSRAIE